MGFSLITALVLAGQIIAADWRVEQVSFAPGSKGAAMVGNAVYSWGEGAHRDGRKLRAERFGPGGCVWDVNGDGHEDLILHRLPAEMIWMEGPRFRTARVIDREADFADCQGATLLGRRGVLVTHRGLQVRFYQVPGDARQAGKWSYREIYSFYTASYQAGLLVRDVDGDGLPDLLCGNYWIQSPERFELPWRLYAINTYNETEESAHMRLAWHGDSLVVSQAEMAKGKVTVFTPAADRKQLWRERRIAEALDHPHAVAWGKDEWIVSEGSRVWLYTGAGRTLLHDGFPLHRLFVAGKGIVGVGVRGGLRLNPLR